MSGLTATDLEAPLAAYVTEATELRSSISWAPDLSPAELVERLRLCRQSLDRMEQITVELTRLKAKTAQRVAEQRGAVEDAWNTQATTRKSFRGWDEKAPRERYADYSAATVDEQRALRDSEKADRMVGAALDVCVIMRWGLDGLRQDFHAAVRAMSFESSLER